jgi:hypothetical protein
MDYRIFGGVVRSAIPLADLPPADGDAEPDWFVSVGSGAAPGAGAAYCGSDVVHEGVGVSLYRSPAGLHFVYDDTGSFLVSADGGAVLWAPVPGASVDAAALDLTGRVLAGALHLRGELVLHASAVAIEGAAVALIGPKRRGKSTLAAALVRSGARLLTDDTLAVGGSPPCARPGVHHIRLHGDAMRAVGRPADEAAGVKHTITELTMDRLATGTVPLAAVYLPEAGPSDAVPARVRFPPRLASLVLVNNAKLGPLLRGGEAPVLLQRAAALARAVPAYRLEFPAGLDRLADVADAVLRWHGGADSRGVRG